MATGGLHVDTSDEIFDFTCSPCAEQNKNREAVRYCVECQDYYCQSCTDMHKMFPAMRGHKLLNKADFNSSSHQQNLPQVPTERCNVHKTKVIDMYCRDHDEVCCTSCVAENHRPCSSVTSITDVVKQREETERDVETLIQEFSSLKKVCLQIKSGGDESMSKIDLAKEMAYEAIKHNRKELETVLDQLENTSRKQVEHEHRRLSNQHVEAKQKAMELENRLTKRISSLQSSTSNKAQQFVSEKLGLKDLAEISEIANTILKDTMTCFEFATDYPSIRQSLLEIESLGEIKRHGQCLFGPMNTLYEVKA
ncbi:transcription intermediary factor 1-beta-like, partial [Mercenaria mercenaria]|uniref:transcription intermediary factor 1-beta-like n=1 Tax=Mercenaria mercenaria TaxID=6596 RepID=UPI00234EDB28